MMPAGRVGVILIMRPLTDVVCPWRTSPWLSLTPEAALEVVQ